MLTWCNSCISIAQISIAFVKMQTTLNLSHWTIFFFCNVGPPKEDIFSDHLLWSIFQSVLHNYILQISSWASDGSFLVFIWLHALRNELLIFKLNGIWRQHQNVINVEDNGTGVLSPKKKQRQPSLCQEERRFLIEQSTLQNHHTRQHRPYPLNI